MKKLINSVFGIVSVAKNGSHLDGKIHFRYLGAVDHTILNLKERDWKLNDNTIVVGYKLSTGDGEFIQIDLSKDKIVLQSDCFGSLFLYYAEFDGSFIFGTEINDLLIYSKEFLSINTEELYRYFAFGFHTFSGKLFYQPINYLKSNSVLTVRVGSKRKLDVSTYKLEREFDYDGYADATANEILQDGIVKRVKHLDLDKIVFTVSAGLDSGILLESFCQLDIPVVCVTNGFSDSDDVLIGRKRSEICKYKHIHYGNFYNLSRDEIKNLLLEYVINSGGIGPIAEAEFLLFLKYICQYGKAIIHGIGGEFYRNRYPSEEYFMANYLTTNETVSKYVFGDYHKEKYLNLINETYNQDVWGNAFEKFYLEERHPNNVCVNKNHMIRPYGMFLSPLVNKHLHSFVFSKSKLGKRTSGEVLHWLRPEKKFFPLENEICKPAIDISCFLSATGDIFEEYIINGFDLATIGINTRNVLKSIRKLDCTERDKWFLARIFNLSMYLTHLDTKIEIT